MHNGRLYHFFEMCMMAGFVALLGACAFLFTAMGWIALQEHTAAPTHRQFTIDARDRAKIRVYETLPDGSRVEEPVPEEIQEALTSARRKLTVQESLAARQLAPAAWCDEPAVKSCCDSPVVSSPD